MAWISSYLLAGSELPSKYFQLFLEVPEDALLPHCLRRRCWRPPPCSALLPHLPHAHCLLARLLAAASSRPECPQGHRPPWEHGPRGSTPLEPGPWMPLCGLALGEGTGSTGSKLSQPRAQSLLHLVSHQNKTGQRASGPCFHPVFFRGIMAGLGGDACCAGCPTILPLLSPTPPTFPLPFTKLKLPHVSTTVGGVGGQLGRRV